MRWHRGRDPGCRTNWSLLMQLVVHHRPGRADRDDVAQSTIPADIVVAPQRAELVLCTRAAMQVATGGSLAQLSFTSRRSSRNRAKRLWQFCRLSNTNRHHSRRIWWNDFESNQLRDVPARATQPINPNRCESICARPRVARVRRLHQSFMLAQLWNA